MGDSALKTESGTFLLSGSSLSKLLQQHLQEQIARCREQGHRPPGLAVVLVGDNPASLSYIKRKEKVAEKVGFRTFDHRLSADTAAADLSALLRELNETPEVDGILLQWPLPKGFDADLHLREIDAGKDADGLHPYNQGELLSGNSQHPLPCTPCGALALIDLSFHLQKTGEFPQSWPLEQVDLSGQRAVVIGRSVLVGKPLAALLLERNATVTIAHSRTRDIEKLCREADIVVAAVGRKEMVQGDWLKDGAISIDVGINRAEDGKLYGDMHFDSCESKSVAITPVPGGVGPMTVAMLLANTYDCYRKTVSSAEGDR